MNRRDGNDASGSTTLLSGDYVLATKYNDGDPQDHRITLKFTWPPVWSRPLGKRSMAAHVQFFVIRRLPCRETSERFGNVVRSCETQLILLNVVLILTRTVGCVVGRAAIKPRTTPTGKPCFGVNARWFASAVRNDQTISNRAGLRVAETPAVMRAMKLSGAATNTTKRTANTFAVSVESSRITSVIWTST